MHADLIREYAPPADVQAAVEEALGLVEDELGLGIEPKIWEES